MTDEELERAGESMVGTWIIMFCVLCLIVTPVGAVLIVGFLVFGASNGEPQDATAVQKVNRGYNK